MHLIRKLIRWSAGAIALVVILALAWWRTAEFTVDPSALDHLRATAHPRGVELIGAWDAPGGSVLERATYDPTAPRCTVALYGRPLVNLRGDMTRGFRVIVPFAAGQRPTSILVSGPGGGVSFDVTDRKPAPPLPLVEVEAVLE